MLNECRSIGLRDAARRVLTRRKEATALEAEAERAARVSSNFASSPIVAWKAARLELSNDMSPPPNRPDRRTERRCRRQSAHRRAAESRPAAASRTVRRSRKALAELEANLPPRAKNLALLEDEKRSAQTGIDQALTRPPAHRPPDRERDTLTATRPSSAMGRYQFRYPNLFRTTSHPPAGLRRAR